MVAIVSFSLGQYSVKNRPNLATVTEPISLISSATTTSSPENKAILKVVASKSGTKYHLLTCPGAQQIKEENKLYFDSPALARAAGYTPASNCPGLE